MSITVAWDNNDSKIIYLTVDGQWSWEDYYTSMATLHEMMEASEQEVIDVILDMQNGNTFPKNVMSHMQRQSNNQHEKIGMMVVVGAAAFAKILFNMMERIVPDKMSRVKLVDSVDKARGLIKQYRADTLHTRPQY